MVKIFKRIHSITYCEGFFHCDFFFSRGPLKIDYCIIICEHNFPTFSASSREVRKLYLFWFKCFDSQQIKCSINPQASQRGHVDNSELINPSAAGTGLPLTSQPWIHHSMQAGKIAGSLQAFAHLPHNAFISVRWVQVPWDEFNCKYSE